MKPCPPSVLSPGWHHRNGVCRWNLRGGAGFLRKPRLKHLSRLRPGRVEVCCAAKFRFGSMKYSGGSRDGEQQLCCMYGWAKMLAQYMLLKVLAAMSCW